MTQDTKILWLSANKLGYELLKECVKLPNVKINYIVTLSEDSTTKMYDGVDSNVWKEFEIPVYYTKRVNEDVDLIKKLAPDLIVMCGWRQIINKEILLLPKKGFVGFHPTLLPIGRGPAPIINSILNGFQTSALSFYYVGEGLDDGDIIGQEKFNIKHTDYASDVYQKVINSGKKLVTKYIPLLVSGNAPRIPQDHSKAIIFNKLSLTDNEINLNQDSLETILRKIRALSHPYAGAYLIQGDEKMIFWKTEDFEKYAKEKNLVIK